MGFMENIQQPERKEFKDVIPFMGCCCQVQACWCAFPQCCSFRREGEVCCIRYLAKGDLNSAPLAEREHFMFGADGRCAIVSPVRYMKNPPGRRLILPQFLTYNCFSVFLRRGAFCCCYCCCYCCRFRCRRRRRRRCCCCCCCCCDTRSPAARAKARRVAWTPTSLSRATTTCRASWLAASSPSS